MYELIYGDIFYGELGEITNYKNQEFDEYRIGDLVIVSDGDYVSSPSIIVFHDESYKVLGFLNHDLQTLHENYNVEKIASYKLLNDYNIKFLTNFNLSLRKKKVEKLTYTQIKNILGYDFEMVEGEL